MPGYEKLGAFYLGRLFDARSGHPRDEELLYDSRDLTTHAVCLGMTGSGKTGLCVALVEEAALDGIPVLAIDPKGDLGNLMLTFPGLRPGDFAPWIDPGEARRHGLDPSAWARKVASTWRKGLAEWGQDGERIARLRQAAEFGIWTPGGGGGRPLSVLRSFAPPPATVLDDADALRDRVSGAVTALLALLGIKADPLRSREHVLCASILQHAWREGRAVDLAGLIRRIQDPPFDRIGVLGLEAFYPQKERFELAMALNALVASPGFSGWLEGDPLDIDRLLYTEDGRPRVSILSIAHLDDRERTFFVTSLLHELIGWMHDQPGTSSLRALLYIDEVFGMLPPTAMPPTKTPLLRLLKQARAFGLGLVLATQNPVDLDYKALSNIGTWFLGRLQTERDKARVLDGLEGTDVAAHGFDREKATQLLSGMPSRVFLMHDVHEDAPALFHVRWVMSYLRGPLTTPQIRKLAGAAPASPAAGRQGAGPSPGEARSVRPVMPPGVDERFLPVARPMPAGARLVYRPALLGSVRLHWLDRKRTFDIWREEHLLAPLPRAGQDPWTSAEVLERAPEERSDPEPGADFAELPAALGSGALRDWSRRLVEFAYRERPLVLWRCPTLKLTSQPGESGEAFAARVDLAQRERRDLAVDKLRRRWAPKLARLEQRIRRAEQRVERERSQYGQQKMQTAISVAATMLGALFGRKALGVGTVGRAATSARGLGRTARERGDVARAQEELERLRSELAELEQASREEIEALAKGLEQRPTIETMRLPPRKSDVSVTRCLVAWEPWAEAPGGAMNPLL